MHCPVCRVAHSGPCQVTDLARELRRAGDEDRARQLEKERDRRIEEQARWRPERRQRLTGREARAAWRRAGY